MVDVLYKERNDSILVRNISEYPYSVYLTHFAHGISCQLLFMPHYVVHADAFHIFNGFGKTIGGYIVGSASFKLKWQFLKYSLFEGHALNHLTTSLIWWHALKPFLFTIQYTYSGGAVHLVSTESEEVTVHLLYINGDMWSTLCTIYHNWYIMLMCRFYNIVNGIDSAKNVAHMGDAHKFSPLCKHIFKIIENKLTAVSHWYHFYIDTFLSCYYLPRYDIRVVFHNRHYHLISSVHECVGV